MSAKKGFLPQHPKIMRKLPKNYNVSNNTYFSNEASKQQERIIQQILQNQRNKIRDLEQKILITKLKNDNTKTALQFYQPQIEIDEIQIQINKLKEQQNELVEKIKNCEIVEKTTTVEQYYLWQKKQIIEDHQYRVNLLVGQKKQQKQKLVNYVQDTINSIKQTKQYIKNTTKSLHDMQKNKDITDDENEGILHGNRQKIQKMKQKYVQYIASIQIQRQNYNILKNQVIDNIEARQQSLRNQFNSYEVSLIKDLTKIKQQVEREQIIPPTSQQIQFKSQPLFKEYEQRMIQLQKQLKEQLKLKQIIGNVKPMNFQNINNYIKVQEDQSLKQNQIQYKKVQEEYIKNQQQIGDYQNGLKQTIDDTVVYQQKNYQIDSALHKILQLGISLV